ncbi:MAG: hypothetical protein EBT47_05240 [Chloroflexi bacterium]|nr:hypothetical protein [Chloroflexota bacterium]
MTVAFCLVAKRAPTADAAGSITNTSVVLGTTTAGAVTTATIGFKPQSAIPSGGTVRITFPGAPSAYTLSPTAISGTGFATGTVFTVQSLLATTITVAATNPGGGFVTTGGTALTVTLNGVRLPPNATTGTLGVLDALTTVDAQSATLDTISGSLAFPQLTTATFTGMSISLSSTTKGATGIMTVGFTTVNGRRTRRLHPGQRIGRRAAPHDHQWLVFGACLDRGQLHGLQHHQSLNRRIRSQLRPPHPDRDRLRTGHL